MNAKNEANLLIASSDADLVRTKAFTDFDPADIPDLQHTVRIKSGDELGIISSDGFICQVFHEPSKCVVNVTNDVVGVSPQKSPKTKQDLLTACTRTFHTVSRWDVLEECVSNVGKKLDFDRCTSRKLNEVASPSAGASRDHELDRMETEDGPPEREMNSSDLDEDISVHGIEDGVDDMVGDFSSSEEDKEYVPSDTHSCSDVEEAPKKRSPYIPESVYRGQHDNIVPCSLCTGAGQTANATKCLMKEIDIMYDDAHTIKSEDHSNDTVVGHQWARAWTADEKEYSNYQKEREDERSAIQGELIQKQSMVEHLESQAQTEDVIRALRLNKMKLKNLQYQLDSFPAGHFHLGVSHTTAILIRAAFQVAPFLKHWLQLGIPSLSVWELTSISEVKCNYWLTSSLICESMVLAWIHAKQRLGAADWTLSPLYRMWDWVISEVVQPGVLLHQAGVGRDLKSRLTHDEAWPLFLLALKKGLKLCLISGKHPKYAAALGRHLRELHLLPRREFARWTHNIWVTLNGKRFTNDMVVETFAVKALKELLTNFNAKCASRKQDTMEMMNGIRRAVNLNVHGEQAEHPKS